MSVGLELQPVSGGFVGFSSDSELGLPGGDWTNWTVVALCCLRRRFHKLCCVLLAFWSHVLAACWLKLSCSANFFDTLLLLCLAVSVGKVLHFKKLIVLLVLH